MQPHKMYINGEFTDSLSGKTRDIINPANGAVIAVVPEAQPEDIAHAVQSARAAFDHGPWRKTTPLERQKLLLKLAAAIREKFDFLAELEVKNNGKPLREAQYDVDDASNCFEFYAGLATKIHGETMQVPANSFSYVLREPIGVCGQIIPWNYPLLMSAWKLAPALAAGNCVILKPSELTPLTALALAEIIHEVGFPAGVVNIVTGDGATAGNALVNHTDIDKIAFTGGTLTGKKIGEAAARNLKRLTLELGGKNPVIVFDDANMDLAVDWCVFAAFANSGQVCTAGSRILVNEKIYDVFVIRFLETVERIKVGNGLTEGVTMGPVISAQHRDKIEAYIALGISEATIVHGGRRLTGADYEGGYYLEPTVFVDVPANARIAREEIFGPVVAIMRFSEEQEAINMANDTEYGLGYGIFTENVTRVHRVVPQIRAGIGWVNCYHPTYNEMPWGGYKQSGTGRELGLYGIEGYLEIKQVNISLDVKPVGWY